MKELNNFREFLAAKELNKTQLNESAPGYDTRKFGGALPTLESVKAAYEAKGEKEEVKEGIWNIGNADDISKFIETLMVMKDDYYAVVGSDTVMDGLDTAIKGAEELLYIKTQGE